MDRLKISTRLYLLILGLLVLLSAVAASGLYGMSQADDALKKVFERSVTPMATVAAVQERLLRNRLAVAAALITPDDATIDSSAAEIDRNIEAIASAQIAQGNTDLSSRTEERPQHSNRRRRRWHSWTRRSSRTPPMPSMRTTWRTVQA